MKEAVKEVVMEAVAMKAVEMAGGQGGGVEQNRHHTWFLAIDAKGSKWLPRHPVLARGVRIVALPPDIIFTNAVRGCARTMEWVRLLVV